MSSLVDKDRSVSFVMIPELASNGESYHSDSNHEDNDDATVIFLIFSRSERLHEIVTSIGACTDLS